MQGERNQWMHMKKSAFRSKIRREWLDNLFQERRAELMKVEKAKSQVAQVVKERCEKILERLPDDEAADQLTVEFIGNKDVVVNFFKENLSQFMETGKELTLKHFRLYISILENIIIVFQDQTKELMQMTMRQVLGQGYRLMREHKTFKYVVVQLLIEYLLTVSKYFWSLDQITLSEVIPILREGLGQPGIEFACNQVKQKMDVCYLHTLEIVNQFLMSSVQGLHEVEDQENIDEKDEIDWIFMKNDFIIKMFRDQPNCIPYMFEKLSTNPDNYQMTMTTMQILTNVTYFTVDPVICEIILESRLDHLIFSVLSMFPRRHNIFTLMVRFLNNFLLFNQTTTSVIIESIHLPQLIGCYSNIKLEDRVLVEEMCEMLNHLVCFMENYKSVIDYLVKWNLVDILVEGCSFIDNEEMLAKIICCLMILINFDKSQVCMKVRQNHGIFRVMLENDEGVLHEMAGNLLEVSFKEVSDERSSPCKDSTQQKDIEI